MASLRQPRFLRGAALSIALSLLLAHLTLIRPAFAHAQLAQSIPAANARSNSANRVSVGEVLAQWMLYSAMALLVGGLVFTTAVWQPARNALSLLSLPGPDRLSAHSGPGRSLIVGAVIIAIISSLLALFTKAGQVGGGELAAPWEAATARVLFDTRYGTLWLARWGRQTGSRHSVRCSSGPR